MFGTDRNSRTGGARGLGLVILSDGFWADNGGRDRYQCDTRSGHKAILMRAKLISPAKVGRSIVRHAEEKAPRNLAAFLLDGCLVSNDVAGEVALMSPLRRSSRYAFRLRRPN